MIHTALIFLAGIAAGVVIGHFCLAAIAKLRARSAAFWSAELAELEIHVRKLESIAFGLPRDVAAHVAELRKMLDALKRI